MSVPVQPVSVYAVTDVLVVDCDKIDLQPVADLVAVAPTDTKSISQGIDAVVQEAGTGTAVQRLPVDDAGFAARDVAVAHPAPNLLVVTKQNHASDGDGAHLAAEIVTM